MLEPLAALEAESRRIDGALEELVERELAGCSSAVAELVGHAVLAPGKRVRPLLVVAAYEAGGGSDTGVVDLACSVELVHAYSLIHDDLPCMDDDLLRRGRPTAHVLFGVGPAILGGASLMPLAIQTVWQGSARLGLDESRARALTAELAAASGGAGMVGGQLLDLRAEGRETSPAQLERIHRGKTARLIAASAVMGAMAAGLDPAGLTRFRRFGGRLGLAFQVIDDILDMTGTTREMGKTGGRDAALGKATYPSVLGIEAAERRGRELASLARLELQGLEGAEALHALTDFVVDRRH